MWCEQLTDAARLDRLDLQARQAHFQPLHEVGELLALRPIGRERYAVAAQRDRPRVGAGAEQQGGLKPFRLQIAQQILIGPHAAIALVQTAVPLVEDEGKGAPLALLQEQLPAELDRDTSPANRRTERCRPRATDA